MLFENMGILYLGPVDGHNIPAMVKLFKEASKVEGPVLVHVITEKGKGYLPAERHPARFHGTEAFDVETGLPLVKRLLSGNVFCGHCGGRLTLTTNGTTRVNAAGEKVGRKRIRYVCYNKTRKRSNCDGQIGYTMHILDKMVTDILHQVFDRMRSVEENEIISRTHRSAMVSLKKRLSDAKAESAKATKEYESLKLEVIKAVQGESAFPMDILSELVNNARTRMLDANAQLTELNEEVEKSNQRVEAIKADYRRIMEWSEMFDGSDMDVKKMIAGYIIKRVDVYSDYRLHIEFNMSFAQFELGLETEVEYEAQNIVS